MTIRRNDEVVVTTGKDKGKTGKVVFIFPERGRALVEKINMIKKHQKPTQKMPRGGLVEKEASIHLSNLMNFCPRCRKGVRVGVKIDADSKKRRVCKKCGETLGQ